MVYFEEILILYSFWHSSAVQKCSDVSGNPIKKKKLTEQTVADVTDRAGERHNRG